MTAVTESLKPGQKKQKDRRREEIEKKEAAKEVVVNDPKKAEVPLEEAYQGTNDSTEEKIAMEEINGKLIAWATGLKDIAFGLAEIDRDHDYSMAKSMLLTISLEFIDSVERRMAEWQDDELEERRRKDRELTEQDKEIMSLVKELQDPNLS